MPLSSIWFPLRPIVMLIGSNVFMTTAWYGHLRFKEVPLFGVIVASWLIAFVEYFLAVPANRFGSAIYSTAQLKTIQEVITLVVFAGFSVAYLREPLTWNYAIGSRSLRSAPILYLRARSGGRSAFWGQCTIEILTYRRGRSQKEKAPDTGFHPCCETACLVSER